MTEGPSLEATAKVLESPDHYRATRYARILDELAAEEGLPSRARQLLARDAELAGAHAKAAKAAKAGR